MHIFSKTWQREILLVSVVKLGEVQLRVSLVPVPWVLTPYAQHFKANNLSHSTQQHFLFLLPIWHSFCARKNIYWNSDFSRKNKKQTQNRMKKENVWFEKREKKWFFSRIAVELKSVFWIIYDINLNILVAKRLLWLSVSLRRREKSVECKCKVKMSIKINYETTNRALLSRTRKII